MRAECNSHCGSFSVSIVFESCELCKQGSDDSFFQVTLACVDGGVLTLIRDFNNE